MHYGGSAVAALVADASGCRAVAVILAALHIYFNQGAGMYAHCMKSIKSKLFESYLVPLC